MSDPQQRTSVEQRLARMEAIHEIQEVKYRYIAGTDFGYDLDQIASCFTIDGRWRAEGFADCHGRTEIKEFFGRLKQVVTMALHYATNPRIEVGHEGLTAVGRFHLWCACTMIQPGGSTGSDAVVMLGTYSDTFRKIDGEWLIEELDADVRHVSEWTQGWANQPWRQ